MTESRRLERTPQSIVRLRYVATRPPGEPRPGAHQDPAYGCVDWFQYTLEENPRGSAGTRGAARRDDPSGSRRTLIVSEQ